MICPRCNGSGNVAITTPALSDRLVCFREARGYTQRQAARLSGISSAQMNHMESGHSANPTLTMLKSLSKLYGVTLTELIGEES